MAKADTLTVDGYEIPLLGLGTWQLEPDDARRMVGRALTNGYRHIDTAWIYRNEKGVGEGIRDAGLARDAFWLTTKIWVDHFSHDALLQQAEESVESLGTAPDLLLLHWPKAPPPLAETIGALNGAIGLSNFPSAEWKKAQDLSEARLITNQVEYHPYLSQKTLIGTAAALGSSITAWSPLAQGKIVEDATIRAIAEAHGKSAGQVTLRWIVQQCVIAIPKTSKESRAAENLDIFDFELTDAEMARIHARARPDGRLGDWLDDAFEWDQDTSQ